MNDFRVSSMNPPAAPSWSAEEEADRLMDDVFSDIDSLLSGKKISAKVVTTTTPEADYTALQSLVVPQIELEDGGLGDDEAAAIEIQLKRGWGYYTERLFFIGSCASLLGVALVMAVNDRLRVPQFLTGAEPVAEVAVAVESDVVTEPIFADYVRRALDNIERKQTPPAVPVSPDAQGTVSLAPEQNPVAGQSPQVIERIYIPVYPPEIAANGQAPIQQSPAPKVTPSPQVLPPTPPTPPQVLTQIEPPPAPLSLNSIPTIPAPPAAAKEIYTLVGVLEAGDRSAALFNIDGSTQRFKVGELIGASNWKLVSIQNQQILIGQGGQTRTLYVGQNFGLD